jgi:hypothetical protein
MKNLLKIVSIIGLTVITQTAYSAEVKDTFDPGDRLTAAKINNIKNAVNDNDTRISDILLTPRPAGANGTNGKDGADSTVAGPTGPAGLGAVIFGRAPTVNDDMNNPYSVGTVWVDTSTNKLYILEDSTANKAVWTIAAAPAVTYALGDTGPAGGFVFYVTDGGLHGLEAAPTDQSTGIRWDNASDPATDTSAIGDGVGAGAMNTMLIIANQGADSTTYAAGIAANLVITHSDVVYGDWYLPSKYELNLMYVNLHLKVVGGFASDYYWSSSQSNSSHTWNQYFATGFQGGFKSKSYRVRAVRAF